MPLATALGVSVIIALAGWRLRALTPAGAAVATLVGTAVLWGAGAVGLAALGVFFAGSSAISRVAPDPGRAFDAKGHVRDPRQVLANGGAAAVGALVPGAGPWIVTMSLAVAAADTWATAAGAWSPVSPRHLVTLQRVPAGTSGAISWYGSMGALAGAGSVAGAAALVLRDVRLFGAAVVVGLLGMLLDSLLGATLQGRFHCPACDQATERARHRCGTAAAPTGGWRWLGNDGVNGVATSAGALAGWALWCWLSA